MKNKSVYSLKVFEIRRIISAMFLLTSTGILLDIYVFPFILLNVPFTKQILLVSNKDSIGLLEYAWSVQASLATIAIALLTLLTGFIKDEKYGVRFLEYITLERPLTFLGMNIWEETAVLILLSGISYFFVAKDMMSTIVFLFIVSIILIMNLIYRVISFFVYSDKSVERVRKIVLGYELELIDLENKE